LVLTVSSTRQDELPRGGRATSCGLVDEFNTNSLLEREAAAEALRAAKKEGSDPKEWLAMPPLRGLSNEAAGKIINAINAFIISRRFQDELAEKRRADDLETRLNEALELVERYRKRVDKIAASNQGNH
jgi:hypothetical protein